MNVIRNIYKYTVANTEYVITVIILAGLITFNKLFAYVGIENIYITEFLSALCITSVGIKFITKWHYNELSIDRDLIKSWIERCWPLMVITVYLIVRLAFDIDYGFLAIRHSMIFLYTILFTLLFVSSIKTEKQLFFLFVYVIIVLSSLFNGTKIIVYKYLHYSLNFYEPERVYHIETDTICASLSLLGLVVYRTYFLSKSKAAYFLLILLNLVILFLTVKRSAILGMLPSIILYALLMKNKFEIRKILAIAMGILLACIILLSLWWFADQPSLLHYVEYIQNKLSPHENNANWRLEAWKIAWHKFMSSPIWGIGYGPKIVDLPVNNVDTNDPHNSFLAFLTRHGVVMFLVFLFFIGRTYTIIIREIRATAKDSIAYNNAMFICLGLTAMIVFAFFNVVFENQYEGIFFNLFLSAIYVVKAQQENWLADKPLTQVKLSYGVLALSLTFVFYAFSPFNHPKKISVYSARTNYSLPEVMKNNKSNISVTSLRDNGIKISFDNEQQAYSELFWFFPVQADKLNFKEYNLFVETSLCMKEGDIKFYLSYENEERVLLNAQCDDKVLKFSLKDVTHRHQDAKIKFIVLKLPNLISIKNLIIKNIYLGRESQ